MASCFKSFSSLAATRALLSSALALGVAAGAAFAQCTDYTVAPVSTAFIRGVTDIGNHGEDVMTTLPLPFTFTFYGVPYSTVNISSNGYAEFGATIQDYVLDCIPTDFVNAPVIFPYWFHATTAGPGAGHGIFTSLSGPAGSRVFTIEWRSTIYNGFGDHGASLAPNQNFELILYENHPYFDVVYNIVPQDGAEGANVGVQRDATLGTPYRCDVDNPDHIPNGSALRFTCTPLQSGACCIQGACTIVASARLCNSSSFFPGGTCSPLPCVPPANDLCTGATDLNVGSMPKHIIEDARPATTDSAPGIPDPYHSGIWFTYTAQNAGFLTYTEAHLKYDYSNQEVLNAQPATFTLRNTCGGSVIPQHGYDPLLSMDSAYAMAAGETVKIVVSTNIPYFNIGPGVPLWPFDMNFNFIRFATPTNNSCSTAINLADVGLPYETLVDNTLAGSDPTNCGTLYHRVWYTYTAPSAGRLFFADTGSQMATWAATTSPCGSSLTCVGDQTDRQLMVLQAGQTVNLAVGSEFSDIGLRIEPLYLHFAFAPTAANDTCATAIDLTSVQFPYATWVDNVISGDDAASCGTIHHGVWYTFTAPRAGHLVCSENGSETALWATAPACGSTPTCVPGESIDVALTAGQTIKLLVGSMESEYTDSDGDPETPDPIDNHAHLDLAINFVTPVCRADYDGNNVVNVSDIFAFLRGWFAHDFKADMDGNNAVNVSDIFAFLRAWFAHC